MSKKITISEERKYEMIECNKCKQEFVLFGVIISYEDTKVRHLIAQIKVDFCPYCGVAQETTK